MGGIFGYLDLDDRGTRPGYAEKAASAMSHRAAHGYRVWSEGPVKLGQASISIAPINTARPPLFCRGNAVIAADARIDNSRELANHLGVASDEFGPVSDEVVILAAYAKWGTDCPNHLLGDFAFAIWDAANALLFCARDHLGVKPFYYYLKPDDRFAFASEIKGVFALTGKRREVNEERVVDFLLSDVSNRSSTFYANVFRLPPACSLVLPARSGALRIAKYWTLDSAPNVVHLSDSEYADAFADLFSDSVKARIRNTNPVGTMLSGGLDSSSVACVARHILDDASSDEQIHTFSIVFDDLVQCDEKPAISSVLDRGGFQPHFVSGDKPDPLADLETTLWYQDEPFIAPNLFLNRRVWSSAREQGIGVLLDGLLGDNVVSHGVEVLAHMAFRWQLPALASELRQHLRVAGSSVSIHNVLLRYLVDYAIKPHIPDQLLQLRRRWRGWPIDSRSQSLVMFNPRASASFNVPERIEHQRTLDKRVPNPREAHSRALECGLVEAAFETYDRGCAEFGIEPRFPFSDKRLVEFCVGTPGTQKVGTGYTRLVQRRAMARYLPHDVCWRRDKGDLGPSFLKGVSDNAERIESILRGEKDFLEHFLTSQHLSERVAAVRGSTDPDRTADAYFLAVLAAWHQAFGTWDDS